MSSRWRDLLVGALLASFLALLAERGYHTWQWAGEVNLEAKAAAGYLGAKIPGTPYRRYELIDIAITEYINNHKALEKK